MNATSQVIPPAPLFYHHLQMALSESLNAHSQCYKAQVPLTQECREELIWWDTHMINWNGKSLLKKEVDIVIDSDASLMGWGATSQNQRTGGPWSQAESNMHINCLELLAATLAMKTFLKNKTRMSVLLRLDNTTAVAYINNLGGTVSKELVDLAKGLWMWCLERNIHITAQHLPGVQNVIADAESRTMIDRSDWQLNPVIFDKIVDLFGPVEVDLFASRLTAQCPAYFSWRPDPYAVATDAFLQDWSQIKGYANPPWSLIGRVLSKVQMERAEIVLVAPVWKTQPWYPLLLQMLIVVPRLISHDQVMLYRDPEDLVPQLAVWHISGRDTETRSFRRKLPHSCSNYGALRPISLTTHSLASGIAGVVQEVQIPFQGHNLHKEGYQYRSLNAYRSAISSVHERVDGFTVGQHPLVTRLMKGVFNDRPPLPRYTCTWNVQTVLTCISSWGSNDSLSLKQLSWKTTMLLALTRPSRSADLSQLSLSGKQYRPNGVTFKPSGLAKQSRQGKPLTEFFFPSFPHDPGLCPMETLKSYETRTAPNRGTEEKLFLALIKPYKALTSSTIARWLKSLLEAAGINTSVFSAHSVRGASSSAAANLGITTNEILKAADWS